MFVLSPPQNLLMLNRPLEEAAHAGYALGSFSPRYTRMIAPVLRAAENLSSPIIVQISSNELRRYTITAEEFARIFFHHLSDQEVSVPVVLHLDHTKDPGIIASAISAGFTSVMIDASDKPLAENIAATVSVVEYAHARGVSVEAELGRIGTTDFIETDDDKEAYTDPDEAAYFAEKTGVDALAVSVGTAHGVYNVRKPKIDFERLNAIRKRTPVHLVLHGGSGVPPEMVKEAIRLGISKVNIATYLEHAALSVLGLSERLSNAEMNSLPEDRIAAAQEAVAKVVGEKIRDYVGSAGRAR